MNSGGAPWAMPVRAHQASADARSARHRLSDATPGVPCGTNRVHCHFACVPQHYPCSGATCCGRSRRLGRGRRRLQPKHRKQYERQQLGVGDAATARARVRVHPARLPTATWTALRLAQPGAASSASAALAQQSPSLRLRERAAKCAGQRQLACGTPRSQASLRRSPAGAPVHGTPSKHAYGPGQFGT